MQHHDHRRQPLPAREPRHEAQWPVVCDAGQGVTRNLSATGLYVELDDSPPPGQTLALSVALDVMGRRMQWQCRALVIHQDTRDGRAGFGARILDQRLVDLD